VGLAVGYAEVSACGCGELGDRSGVTEPIGRLQIDEATSPAEQRLVSARLDPTWRVLASPSTKSVDRCIDIFVRPDGTFGFEEFRRDPEDMGAWTPVAYYSHREFPSEVDVLAAARDSVPWLPGVLDG
jgi:hypothetical protein